MCLFSPSLVGADARAIYLHNDLLYNDKCSVTERCITYSGGGGGAEWISKDGIAPIPDPGCIA